MDGGIHFLVRIIIPDKFLRFRRKLSQGHTLVVHCTNSSTNCSPLSKASVSSFLISSRQTFYRIRLLNIQYYREVFEKGVFQTRQSKTTFKQNHGSRHEFWIPSVESQIKPGLRLFLTFLLASR